MKKECILVGLLFAFLLAPITGNASRSGSSDATNDEAVILRADSHVIVLEPDASPSEVHAAEELQAYLLQATGSEPPIVQDPADATAGMIVLGCGPTARELGVDPDPVDMGEQGYLLRTVSPHIVIAGTPEAGTMYGVHRFLEDSLHVRWYAPGVTHVPTFTELSIPPIDVLVQPPFLWRHTSWEWPGADEDFWAHMGDNDGTGGPDNPTGIQHARDGGFHSYFRYVSPDEFFDTHPEYFSEIGGERIREETQLCLTNPEVLDIVTERMLERIAENPDYRQYNFAQQDHYNYCECDPCRAMYAQYGTTGATQFWFVNLLAERIATVYPDKLVGTLAYTYTEEPPVDMEMHSNVVVWLCHMYPSCDSHPVRTCSKDADYKRRAELWAEISSHMIIWNYTTNFTHYYNPFPNFWAMADDIRFYRDIGVEGIYLQGMGHSGGGGEFSLLRPYYGMKLLWDPDQDEVALMQDWLKGYYGQAWLPIYDYIRLLHDKVTEEDIHMHLYTNPAQGYLSDDLMLQANAHFAAAERMVRDDPELLDRVQVARMPLTYAEIFPRNGYTLKSGWLDWNGHIASFEETEEFLDLMDAHGFNTIMEFFDAKEMLSVLHALFKAPLAIRTIENPYLSVEVVPLLAGRALRIVDKSTGACVTAYNVTPNLWFPFAGGLEDRSGELASYYGWVEPLQAIDFSRRAITVSGVILDGLELTRSMALDPDDPVLYVESMLTNPSETAKQARLRSHLVLDLGTLRDTRMSFVTLGGERVEEDMTEVLEGMREGVHFYREDTPDGEWTFSGTKGLQFTQRFDSDQVDFTWVYAYPEENGELEVELWSPSVTLQPGESVVITQSLEVVPVQP